MKLISLWEPWATLMAIGAKKIETRSWSTSYKGSLAIHASKGGLSKQRLRESLEDPVFHLALNGHEMHPGAVEETIVSLGMDPQRETHRRSFMDYESAVEYAKTALAKGYHAAGVNEVEFEEQDRTSRVVTPLPGNSRMKM